MVLSSIGIQLQRLINNEPLSQDSLGSRGFSYLIACEERNKVGGSSNDVVRDKSKENPVNPVNPVNDVNSNNRGLPPCGGKRVC